MVVTVFIDGFHMLILGVLGLVILVVRFAYLSMVLQ
jgi:hypothetical protein